jgi:hypothetical protein
MGNYFLIFTLAANTLIAMDGQHETAPSQKQLSLLAGVSLSIKVHPDDKAKVKEAEQVMIEKNNTYKEAKARHAFLKTQYGC